MLSTTGASPRSFATRAPSSVADIGEDAQILAQACSRIERERETEIGIERALMKFVEQDGGDAGKFGIVASACG